MTLFLRTKTNKTIVDIELWVKKEDEHSFVELSSSIDIQNYSIFLLNNLDKKLDIINDFELLSELRGWLWENYFMTKKNTPEEYNNVLKELKTILEEIGDKYGLHLVTD